MMSEESAAFQGLLVNYFFSFPWINGFSLAGSTDEVVLLRQANLI